jgi:hypothetical protein
MIWGYQVITKEKLKNFSLIILPFIVAVQALIIVLLISRLN